MRQPKILLRLNVKFDPNYFLHLETNLLKKSGLSPDIKPLKKITYI